MTRFKKIRLIIQATSLLLWLGLGIWLSIDYGNGFVFLIGIIVGLDVGRLLNELIKWELKKEKDKR